MSDRLTFGGLSLEEHQAMFPDRWRKRVRAWPYFWWSLSIVPVLLGLNWATGQEWERADTHLCMGWAMSRFWIAFDPSSIGRTTTMWFLDKPTLWQRLRKAVSL